MKVGVVGLGLIGGSFAKAYKKEGHTVLASDIDEGVMTYASLCDAIDGKLTKEEIPDCDIILVCTYPQAAIEFLKDNAKVFGNKPVIIDCCGTKANIVENGMKLAKENGFTYAGGHPMAGTQFSGMKYARDNLYNGAPMVIVPPDFDDVLFLERVKELLSPAGFGSISVTTAEAHDSVIAFTSQLAHVVSNAYVKSPTAKKHRGFSAGSYKDLTRVARLNPEMWSELFLENKDNLIFEIEVLVENLNQYKDALVSENREVLKKLLEDGSNIKQEIDG